MKKPAKWIMCGKHRGRQMKFCHQEEMCKWMGCQSGKRNQDQQMRLCSGVLRQSWFFERAGMQQMGWMRSLGELKSWCTWECTHKIHKAQWRCASMHQCRIFAWRMREPCVENGWFEEIHSRLCQDQTWRQMGKHDKTLDKKEECGTIWFRKGRRLTNMPIRFSVSWYCRLAIGVPMQMSRWQV